MTTATLRRTHPPIGLAVAVGTVLWLVAWFLALPAAGLGCLRRTGP